MCVSLFCGVGNFNDHFNGCNRPLAACYNDTSRQNQLIKITFVIKKSAYLATTNANSVIDL